MGRLLRIAFVIVIVLSQYLNNCDSPQKRLSTWCAYHTCLYGGDVCGWLLCEVWFVSAATVDRALAGESLDVHKHTSCSTTHIAHPSARFSARCDSCDTVVLKVSGLYKYLLSPRSFLVSFFFVSHVLINQSNQSRAINHRSISINNPSIT